MKLVSRIKGELKSNIYNHFYIVVEVETGGHLYINYIQTKNIVKLRYVANHEKAWIEFEADNIRYTIENCDMNTFLEEIKISSLINEDI